MPAWYAIGAHGLLYPAAVRIFDVMMHQCCISTHENDHKNKRRSSETGQKARRTKQSRNPMVPVAGRPLRKTLEEGQGPLCALPHLGYWITFMTASSS